MDTRYMVVVGHSIDDLESQVNGFMQAGWKPVGGVTIDKDAFSDGETIAIYLQSMTINMG